MLFNPFKYQFEAQYLRDENSASGETQAILKIRKGSEEAEVHFPKKLLPPELQFGDTTSLSLQPQESLKKDEAAVLKQLLEDLIQ